MAHKRMPALDGLRALAVLLLLMDHMLGTRGFLPLESMPRLDDLVSIAPQLFFVLSGFLITHLCLREMGETGRLSLKRFYARRALRILPPFLVFVATVGLIASVGTLTLMRGDLLHTVTFTMNFHAARSWVVGHTWSLSAEEQFYLLWPPLLVVFGTTGAAWGAVAAVIAAPLVRIALYVGAPGLRQNIDEAFPTVMDALASGCLLAIFRNGLHAFAPYRRFIESRASLVLVAVIAAGQMLSHHPAFSYLVGETVTNFALVCTIDRLVSTDDGRIVAALTSRPAVFISTLSYSLYLWQQLFLNRHAVGPLVTFPINIIAAVMTATACHYLVERPVMRIRQRWVAGIG